MADEDVNMVETEEGGQDPLGIIKPSKNGKAKNVAHDPLGILKKKDESGQASPLASTPASTKTVTSTPSSGSTLPSLHETIFGSPVQKSDSPTYLKQQQEKNAAINRPKNEEADLRKQEKQFIDDPTARSVADDKTSLLNKEENILDFGKTDEERSKIHAQVSAFRNNFFNGTLTPEDVDLVHGNLNGVSAEQAATAINNKTKNLKAWGDAPLKKGVKNYISELDKINKQISELETINNAVPDKGDYRKKTDAQLSDLQDQKAFLQHSLTQIYDRRSDGAATDIISKSILPKFDGASWDDIFENPDKHYPLIDLSKPNSPLQWDKKSKTLTKDAETWVRGTVDNYLNQHPDEIINASTSGDVDNKERNYPAVAQKVINYLNTVVPVANAHKNFRENFIKENPDAKDYIEHQSQIEKWFSKQNIDAADAYAKTFQDKQFIGLKEKYYGDSGIFQSNSDFVKIQHDYAEKVHNKTMSEDVAKNQIEQEVKNNPTLKKIYQNEQTDLGHVRDKTKQMWAQFITNGLSKVDPNVAFNTDGTVSIKGKTAAASKKIIDAYNDGLARSTADILHTQHTELGLAADERAKRLGSFVSTLKESADDVGSAFSKFWFDKTGYGGDDVRAYQGEKSAEIPVSQSDEAKKWQYKGMMSLADPNFYLSKVGSQLPLFAGAATVGLLTEGTGLPEYASWLASAGLFDAQMSLSTYNNIVSSGATDVQGNPITQMDAASAAADQFKQTLPLDMLFMAVNAGVLSRAKNIVKPSIGRQLAENVKGAVVGAIPMAWQGYLGYATDQQVQGKKADLWDYAQDGQFTRSLIDGIIGGSILSLAHSPSNYVKQTENWKKMIYSSEGEFKNNSLYNISMQHEANGMGEQWIDALKIKLGTEDLTGKENEKAALERSLKYSVALNRTIKGGELDPKNIDDLYQAHNIAQADLNDNLAERNKANKNLSKIYSDKAKDFATEAKNAADGSAKFHYLIDANDNPIFLSDNSFKTLEADGKLKEWLKDGNIKEVVKNDDPEFRNQFKQAALQEPEEEEADKEKLLERGKLYISKAIEEGKIPEFLKQHIDQDPEKFLQEVAEQSYGIQRDNQNEGEPVRSDLPNAKKGAEDSYGKEVVMAARKLFPEEQILSEKNKDTGVEDPASIGKTETAPSDANNKTAPEEQEFEKGLSETLGIPQQKEDPASEEKQPEQKDDKRGVMKKAQSIEDLTSPIDVAMQHFTAGGKINSSAIGELFGGKDERLHQNTSTENERRARIGIIGKDAPGIDELAHKLWENSNDENKERYSTGDYKDAIEQVLLAHKSSGSMANELVDKYMTRAVRQELTEDEAKEHSDIMISKMLKEVDGFPPETQQELLGVLQNYQDNYGFIDWEKLEKDSSGFDPDILGLSETSQQALYETIQRNVPEGQSEPGNAGNKNEVKGEGEEKSRIQALADTIRKGKLDKDIALAGIPFAKEVWNGALEAMATSLEAGEKIGDAIGKFIDHVKGSDWYKNLTADDKKKADEGISDFERDEKIKYMVGKSPLSEDQLRASIKKITGLKTEKINDLIKEGRAVGKLVPEETEPKKVLKTKGGLTSTWVRNWGRLESLEKTLGTEQEALQSAYRASSSQGTAKAALNKVGRAMQEEFKGRANQVYTDLRKVLVQSNLNGKRERWNDWSEHFRNAPLEEIAKWATNPKFAQENGLPELDYITDKLEDNPHFRGMTKAADQYIDKNDFDGLKDLMATNFNRAAQLVQDLDFSGGKSYDELRKEPDIQKAKKIYYDEFGSKVEDAQKQLGGALNKYLGEEGVYYPLVSVTPEEGEIKRKWFQKRSAFQKSSTPYDDFATGMGRQYDMSVAGLQDRIVSAYKARDKNSMIETFKTQGYMVPFAKGNREDVVNIQGQYVPAVKININEGSNFRPAYYMVPEGVEKDMRAIINTKNDNLATKDLKQRINNVTGYVNKLTLSTPREALRHSTNLLFRLNKNTPFAFNNIIGRSAGTIPVVKQIMQLGHLAFMDPTAEKWGTTLEEMGAAGEIPDKFGKYTFSKNWADLSGAEKQTWWKGQFGALLYSDKGIDIRARMMMWDINRSINPNATPAEMRRVMSTLGDYNKGLQSSIVTLMKEQTGLAPFIVSQQARLRAGVESFNLLPKYSNLPIQDLPLPKQLLYHTLNLLQSSVYAYAGLWAAGYLASTGKNPFTDENARLGVIPINIGDENFNIGLGTFYTAASVGTKVLGMDAAFDAHAEGEDSFEVIEKGLMQSMNTTTAPAFSGSPVMHVATGLFGVAPYVVSVNDNKGNPSFQLLPTTIPAPEKGLQLPFNIANDVIHTNPLVGAVVDQTMKHTVGYSLEKDFKKDDWRKGYYQALLEELFPGIFVNDVDVSKKQRSEKLSEEEQKRAFEKEIRKQEKESE